jgi:hypothetical protein
LTTNVGAAQLPGTGATAQPGGLTAQLGAARISQGLCVGDCDGNGAVTIEELIIGVRVALGLSILDDCLGFDANGDGTVSIDELVRAVADGLYGCGVTPPTPPPTRTPDVHPLPSATPTPSPSLTTTATATPTSGIPNVSGRWREDQLSISSSTCPPRLTSELARAFRSVLPCDHQVTQDGNQVVIVDCNEISLSGSIDERGTIRLTLPPGQATEAGCTVRARGNVVIETSTTSATAQYDVSLSFSGTCAMPDCRMGIRTNWSKQ